MIGNKIADYFHTNPEAFFGIFSSEISLHVPLAEVIALVIVINLFALFKKARLILATSYLFCLKWVFWANYSELLKHSDALANSCSVIFVFCGILTLVLFWFDHLGSSAR